MMERLSRELVDQVVFGMENQEREFYLDVQEEAVVSIEEIDSEGDGSRFFPVPQWRSVDGYNLMERFVGALHNPIFRERLRQILAAGRGVFRQFKDALKERPEIERLWFSFKEREMRHLVNEWYNDLREQQGLERLELDDEETEQLIASDFVFVDADEAQIERITELDRQGFHECYPDATEAAVDLRHSLRRRGRPTPGDPGSRLVVAETPGGEFAGFVWATTFTRGDVRVATIDQLYVVQEYRGLGLAKALLRHYFTIAASESITEVLLDLPGASAELQTSLEREGMQREVVTLSLDVPKWLRENPSG